MQHFLEASRLFRDLQAFDFPQSRFQAPADLFQVDLEGRILDVQALFHQLDLADQALAERWVRVSLLSHPAQHPHHAINGAVQSLPRPRQVDEDRIDQHLVTDVPVRLQLSSVEASGLDPKMSLLPTQNTKPKKNQKKTPTKIPGVVQVHLQQIAVTDLLALI